MKNKWHISCGHYIGVKHEEMNHVCEDNTLCLEKNDVKVIVLSDGCGSSEFAYNGSLITVESVANLLVERFDEFYNEENEQDSKKKIVDHILDEQIKFANDNQELFNDYIDKNKETFEKYKANKNIQGFYLDELLATVLFVAYKDEKLIYGRIGDGVIGAIVNNKLKIISEEKEEDDDITGTYYPEVLFRLHLLNRKPYEDDNLFTFVREKATDIEGFVLLSDGSDVILDLNTPFQKVFKPSMDTIFRAISDLEGQENKNIQTTKFAKQFASLSRTRDDCSIAILIKEDYKIDEYEITYYERPTITKKETEVKQTAKKEEAVVEKELNKEEIEEEQIEESKFEKDKKVVIEFDLYFYNRLNKILEETNELFQNIISEYAELLTIIKDDYKDVKVDHSYILIDQYDISEDLKNYLLVCSKKFIESELDNEES